MILMLMKYWSLKKNNMVNIIHLNTLQGIMIIMLLDHYIYLFHKWLDILISLKNIKEQCLLWLNINHFQKITAEYGKKIEELMSINFERETN